MGVKDCGVYCRGEKEKRIETTGELVDIIKAAIPSSARRGGPHPAKGLSGIKDSCKQ